MCTRDGDTPTQKKKRSVTPVAPWFAVQLCVTRVLLDARRVWGQGGVDADNGGDCDRVGDGVN